MALKKMAAPGWLLALLLTHCTQDDHFYLHELRFLRASKVFSVKIERAAEGMLPVGGVAAACPAVSGTLMATAASYRG